MVEAWKDIKGFEGLYQVSDLGNVRSLDRVVKHVSGTAIKRGKVLSLSTRKGYLSFTLRKDSNSTHGVVHRLVAEAFIPNPEDKSIVNHKNGIKIDNRVINIEWCTRLENESHASKSGLKAKGSKIAKSKLYECDVIGIKTHLAHGFSQSYIAEIYGVVKSTITKINTGKTWKHVNAYEVV